MTGTGNGAVHPVVGSDTTVGSGNATGTSGDAAADAGAPTARIVVVNAGLSDASSTARLGHAVVEALEEGARRRGTTLEVRVVDLRPRARGIADALTLGFAPADLQEDLDAVARADALVALTPVYRASYSGLFKSFFDILDEDALRGTPVLLGATGGTPRHALVTEMAMRPLFTYLHAPAVPTALYAATEDWGARASDSAGEGGTRLLPRIRRGAEELLDALGGRAAHSPVGPVGHGDRDTPVDEGAAASVTRETASSGATPTAASPEEPYPGFVDFETLLHRGGLR